VKLFAGYCFAQSIELSPAINIPYRDRPTPVGPSDNTHFKFFNESTKSVFLPKALVSIILLFTPSPISVTTSLKDIFLPSAFFNDLAS